MLYLVHLLADDAFVAAVPLNLSLLVVVEWALSRAGSAVCVIGQGCGVVWVFGRGREGRGIEVNGCTGVVPAGVGTAVSWL